MKRIRLAVAYRGLKLSYIMLRNLLFASFIAGSAFAKDVDWKPLFDGKSLDGWTSSNGGKPGDGWKVEEGAIHRAGKGGDIISAKEYKDFEFEFEWKISAKGNSGVKYRVQKAGSAWIGPEYQVLDDKGHPNGKVADTTAASLYEVAPADKDKDLKPVGEWNVSKVVAKGTVLEHWLNGKLTVKIDTKSKEWEKLKKDSKFAPVADFAGPAAGHLLLQDHGDEAWFRNLRIREL